MRACLRMFVAGVLCTVAGAALAAGWSGTYVYEGGFGRSAGGSPILVRYEIRLDDPAGICRINIDGFQAEELLLCEVQAAGDRMTLRFKSHGDGAPANRHGVVVYRPGVPLLELRRTGKPSANGIETRWLGLETPDGRKSPTGRYFVRGP